MIIPISEELRIVSSSTCWTVQEKRVTKKGDSWNSLTYHTSLEKAVSNSAILEVMKISNDKSVPEIIKAINEIKEKYSKILSLIPERSILQNLISEIVTVLGKRRDVSNKSKKVLKELSEKL